MYTASELITNFKSASQSIATSRTESHCKMLNVRAKALGFRNFIDFRTQLEKMPKDELANFSLKLMRQICAVKAPTHDRLPYYEMQVLPSGIGHYSQWIGWDKDGKEVRVPRPLSGRESVEQLRLIASFPIYVIESERELIAWRAMWGSKAYIREDLAKANFTGIFKKDHLIAKNVPIYLIRRASRGEDYNSNDAVD